MMNRQTDWTQNDPLALADLPLLEPDFDGWPEIRAALEQPQALPAWRRHGPWLAAAAIAVMALGLALNRQVQDPVTAGAPTETLATLSPDSASVEQEETLDSLIGMSQMLENRVRQMRSEAGSMPADSAVYVAELEDMVAQVDDALSYTPDSMNLWGQRVNLLLDLAQIYQHQWERDYGRMASL